MLLASDGRVKISDFGSARMVDHGHTTVRTMGTPAFLAPEMCEGTPYHGEVADIWALGICLYMFVYGGSELQFCTVAYTMAGCILRSFEQHDDVLICAPNHADLSDLHEPCKIAWQLVDHDCCAYKQHSSHMSAGVMCLYMTACGESCRYLPRDWLALFTVLQGTLPPDTSSVHCLVACHAYVLLLSYVAVSARRPPV